MSISRINFNSSTLVDADTQTKTAALAAATGTVVIGTSATAGGTNSISIGTSAGSSIAGANGCIAIGANALNSASNATADYNVCVGIDAGTAITTGSSNTLIGTGAGVAMTTLSNNTNIGRSARTTAGSDAVSLGYNSATAATNAIAIGPGALADFAGSICIGRNSDVSAAYSIAIGYNAFAHTGSSPNPSTIAIGAQTYASYESVVIGYNCKMSRFSYGTLLIGQDIGSGGFSGANLNTVIGSNAALNMTNCNRNVAVGLNAASAATTFDYCTMVGWNAGNTAGSFTNLVLIGQNARGLNAATSGIVINGATGTLTLSDAQCKITPLNNAILARSVSWNGTTLIATSSSIRRKEDVTTAEDMTDAIDKIQVRRFRWKGTDTLGVGMIAEELNQLLPDIVPKDSRGLPCSINYDLLCLVLWQEAQKQRQINDMLMKRKQELSDKIRELVS